MRYELTDHEWAAMIRGEKFSMPARAATLRIKTSAVNRHFAAMAAGWACRTSPALIRSSAQGSTATRTRRPTPGAER
jgi:hypothetical protein